MSLQHIPLEKITEADLQKLVQNGVRESRIIEYKQNIQLKEPKQKQELLCDIAAFANTEGGEIIYGMESKDGVPTKLIGLNNYNHDKTVLAIEDLLRNSTDPILRTVRFCVVKLANTLHALVVRIGYSFAAPHLVSHLDATTRFCGRNSAGKYTMGVDEIRSAFVASETLDNRLKAFRFSRIGKLKSGITPVPMMSSHYIVFHILPVVGSRADMRIDSTLLRQKIGFARPLFSEGFGYSDYYNFDGPLLTSVSSNGISQTSLQVFKNGFFEAIDSLCLSAGRNGVGIFPALEIKKEFCKIYSTYISLLNDQLNISLPYVVGISFLNVKGYAIPKDVANPASVFIHPHPIEHEDLIFDEVLIENTNTPAGEVLRSVFDQMWNACGYGAAPT